VVPYDSSASGRDGHAFQYWSLNAHLDIRSPFAFRRGDVVEVSEVGDGSVLVLPAERGEEEPGLMVFASNDIPLDPGSAYEFEYRNCDLLARTECGDASNKVYAMLLGLHPGAEYASVNAFCRRDRTKITFHIGVNHG
jgi:hypothetical protein